MRLYLGVELQYVSIHNVNNISIDPVHNAANLLRGETKGRYPQTTIPQLLFTRLFSEI